jgi:hypothetical protein
MHSSRTIEAEKLNDIDGHAITQSINSPAGSNGLLDSVMIVATIAALYARRLSAWRRSCNAVSE